MLRKRFGYATFVLVIGLLVMFSLNMTARGNFCRDYKQEYGINLSADTQNSSKEEVLFNQACGKTATFYRYASLIAALALLNFTRTSLRKPEKLGFGK